jgi:putative transposase
LIAEHVAAQAELEKIFWQMGHISLSAARSLEEEQQETLTVHRLGVVWLLRRTPTSINPIGPPFATVERVARKVKRWREGEQVLRTTTGSLDAQKRFRRVNWKSCIAG